MLGLAATLARPGGNVTGFTVDPGLEVVSKRFELLKQAVPNAVRIGFLTTHQAWGGEWGRVMRQVAERAGVTPIAVTVGEPFQEAQYRGALTVAATERAQGLVVTDHAEGFANRRLIVELAAQHRLPAIYPYREFVEAGGLMAYAFDPADMRRGVADYVHRILKGARPADLPFQQPAKLELAINLKTAKALGLTIPPSLLARADQVIE